MTPVGSSILPTPAPISRSRTSSSRSDADALSAVDRLGERDVVAVWITQPELAHSPLAHFWTPLDWSVMTNRLVHFGHAVGIDVERAGEARCLGPRCVTREELQRHTIARELAPRDVARLGELALQLETNSGVEVDRGGHVERLEYRRRAHRRDPTRAARQRLLAVMPPSTGITVPFKYEAAGSTSDKMMCATSSGSP